MSEKQFTCVLGKDYHIINNNVDDMTYFLQDGNDVVLVINLMNRLVEENEQLKEKLQSVTMLKDDYEELIESFEKKYGKNIEDVIDDV